MSPTGIKPRIIHPRAQVITLSIDIIPVLPKQPHTAASLSLEVLPCLKAILFSSQIFDHSRAEEFDLVFIRIQ